MTFDLTPEQQALIAGANSITSLPAQAMDAVLVVEQLASKDPARGARFGFEGVGGKSNATAALMPGLEGSESAIASIPDDQPHPGAIDCGGRGPGRWARGHRAHAGVDEEDRREARTRRDRSTLGVRRWRHGSGRGARAHLQRGADARSRRECRGRHHARPRVCRECRTACGGRGDSRRRRRRIHSRRLVRPPARATRGPCK